MKCSYCSKGIEKGTGLMYVRKNGAIKYYCANRCYKMNIVYNRKLSNKELKKRSMQRPAVA